MSCSVVDAKAYFLGELEKRDQAQVENHLGTRAEMALHLRLVPLFQFTQEIGFYVDD